MMTHMKIEFMKVFRHEMVDPCANYAVSTKISIENMICDAVSRSHLGNEIQRETLAPYSAYADLILIPNTNIDGVRRT